MENELTESKLTESKLTENGLTEPADDTLDDLDDQPDGDRQLTTDSAAIDEGNTNDSDLGAEVAGDIGPKHN